MIQTAIRRLVEGRDLARDEARALMHTIMAGEATPVEMATALTALRMKGETVEEIIGAAEAMRAHATRLPDTPAGTLDTCGTGGDALMTFNISTAAAFVAAGAGVPVAKHGNRSITSRSGSADVLEALGVPLTAPVERLSACLRDARFAFLYAPSFHGAMRHAAPVRREMRIRTIFNVLGPLTNPAEAAYQLVGVFDAALAPMLAEALGALGATRAWVVHGAGGLDEIALDGPTEVAAWEDGGVRRFTIEAGSLGLARAPLEALRGGDPSENAGIVLGVLRGGRGPARDIVALNAGAALVVAGAAEDLRDGLARALRAIDEGSAMAALERVRVLLAETA